LLTRNKSGSFILASYHDFLVIFMNSGRNLIHWKRMRPEAEHLLPLRFVEGTRRPPPQSKRAEFPAALPEKKSSKTESPRRNETEIPGKRKPKKNVQTTGAGNCRSRRKLPKQRRTRPRRRWEQERGMRGGSEGTHRLCSKAMKGRLLGFISSSSRTQRRRRRG
jgi:hypothetical protein